VSFLPRSARREGLAVSRWRGWLDHAISALFAPACVGCGETLSRPLEGAVCTTCWQRVRLFAPPLCGSCGVPLTSWRVSSLHAGRCARCRRKAAVLTRQAAIGPHGGVLRDIVHALKYDARLSTVAPLAALMRSAGTDILRDAHVVVPVPLHRRRAWSRGFNQAALLAHHLGPPCVPLLARTRPTPPQVSLPAAQRHRNMRDAFAARPRVATRISGALSMPLARLVVVLVDDVCTTGATLEACGRTLRDAGVGEVRALTASRVVIEPPP
jgi:ComF family protein